MSATIILCMKIAGIVFLCFFGYSIFHSHDICKECKSDCKHCPHEKNNNYA